MIWIRLGGGPNAGKRLILVSDAHGRIIIANGMWPTKTGKYNYDDCPDCVSCKYYVTTVLKNIKYLSEEDENENDRLFDLKLEALRKMELIISAEQLYEIAR